MSDAEVKKLYGSATVSPSEDVVAGSYGTWTLTYTAGEKGIAREGRFVFIRMRIRTAQRLRWMIPQGQII